MTTYLVYQAYGRKSNRDQTLYSILSLVPYLEAHPLPLQIVIYTEDPQPFQKFLSSFSFIHYERLTDDLKNKWLGSTRFVHRLKIEMLIDCAKKYNGHLLYLDGDTYFTQSPERVMQRIQPTLSVMHICEDQLQPSKTLLTRKLFRFLKRNPIYIDGELLKFKTDCRMWNAGVIGLHKDMTWVLEKILKLTDELYSRYPKHIMEQFAVSYYLQKYSQIVGSDDVIEHYWMQKEVYPPLMSAFLDSKKNYLDFKENIMSLQLPVRVYKNPYATFRMRVYQKVPALRPLILALNQWIESPSIES